ncbi:MAG: alpha/beta hydrolase [Planctomycetota bacterium]
MKAQFAGVVLAVATGAGAVAKPPQSVRQERVDLWNTTAPGSAQFTGERTIERRGDARPNGWLTGVSTPCLWKPAPPVGEAPVPAVVICPGGGYAGLAIDKEGHFVAQWLSERGVFGLTLEYRCCGGAHQQPVPWRDVSRAIQTVRVNAEAWGVDPDRIGVMGFSAGGHLAASAATKWAEGEPEASDPADRVSSRPDFAVLVYPVISMRDGVTHGGSRRNLLGAEPTDELIAEWSVDELVTNQTPPTLLIHSADDRAVPVENTLRFFEACRAHEVEAELHVFPTGGHGYGMWATEGTVATWPTVLARWLASQGLTR